MPVSDYKKLRLQSFVAAEERETPEGRFWRKFKLPVVQKLLAPPTHLEFCPVAPHDLAVTVGNRVTIFDYASSREKRSITKFKEPALSASYRSDGKLMVAGGVRPVVQLFDMSSRAVLRSYKGHAGPVHFARFSCDNTRIISASDDQSIRLWDMPTNRQVGVLEKAHDDYIRCGGVSASNPYLVATGSYDHNVRLWDMRIFGGDSGSSSSGSSDAGEVPAESASDEGEGEESLHHEESESSSAEVDGEVSEGHVDVESGDESMYGSAGAGLADISPRCTLPTGCVLSVCHGEPVTQVTLLPGGGSMLTAGGNCVKLWDVVGGGKLLHTFSHHSKLITSMCLDGSNTRLVTAGLDALVKVYELATFSVTHTMRYDAPILSLAVAPDNSRMVVGCTNNSITLKQRLVKVAEIVSERKAAFALRGGTYRYFLRGQATVAAVDDIIVSKGKKPKLRPYDKSLKTFEYASALDAAMATHDPIIITSILRELIARDGLTSALAGRTEDALEPILLFVVKYVADPRFSSLLLDIANVIVDMYTQFLGTSGTIDTLFVKLHSNVMREVNLGKELLALQGALDLLMAASTTGDTPFDSAVDQ